MNALRWDIFCRVVDNLGDIGVCWRLAAQLAARGEAVRLWVDDASELAWMAPGGATGVEVLAGDAANQGYEAGDVVIAAFGCDLAPGVIEAMRRAGGQGARRIPWINLEYLSAEPYAARSHGLASPVAGGAAAGVHKWFFFPGFTPGTGGLLREPDLSERQAQYARAGWFARQRIAWAGERVVSLFCYEPPVLAPWLACLAARPTRLLVAAGRPAAAVRAALAQLPASWNRAANLQISFLDLMPQPEFDELLWAADLNVVRGEDSLVRALWAGAALVWQAYPQDDRAHHAKVEAFLDWLQAPLSLRRFVRQWNGIEADLPAEPDLPVWRDVAAAARTRLLAQNDLVSRLLQFVAENR